MAVEKTENMTGIEIRLYQNQSATLVINTTTTWDDPDDNDLPFTKASIRELKKTIMTTTYDAETGAPVNSETATDISGETQLVQDICAAVWTDA
jgi:hypothetical protein